ncbi:hypothetical protein SAMN05216276_10868 [Streptosporangium subroseum]|uniref:Uncharacterized protein n=1 Tax=Streptosporangium subroseum TaxID=106412 RepID=A0A239P487_9ACTN|nr:DUF6247 family protein [Streptosporangium subroseum]SNT61885.1 hypothetical protein SAMN05216276_10868 [Streptosporangium subroseum]
MTAQPYGPAPTPVPERTPKAIRAALAPQHVEAFDREYRAAMAQATEELDLAPALDFVERWWPIAVLCARGEYQRVTEIAAGIAGRAERGQDLATVSWDVAEARLRARIAAGE